MSENVKPTFAEYGKSFQESILTAFLTDKKFAEQMLEVFDVSYFDAKYLQFLADRYFSYAKKYKTFPTLSLLVTIIKGELKSTVDQVLRDQIIDYLYRAKTDAHVADLPYVKERSLDFCRKQALKSAFDKAVDMMANENYDSIVTVIKTAVGVGTVSSVGHDLTEDVESRFVKEVWRPIPTGISKLDAPYILKGGLGRGKLGVVVAGSGFGKCVDKNTCVNVRYQKIKINGIEYKPWDKISTKRGMLFVRDVVESDELC